MSRRAPLARFAPVVVPSALALSCLAGCASQSTSPQVAPSTGQPVWAIGYADDLEDANKSLSDDRTKAHTVDQGLPQRLADVKSPTNADALAAIVARADAAGRSEAYVSRRRDDDTIRAFWDDERGPIVGRAAGAAKGVVGEAKCEGNPDPSAQVAYAVKDGIDKALEKKDRQSNDAQVLVDRYKVALGQGNYVAAQKLADDVALSSYLAYVALVSDENRITALLAERQQAKDTLERAIADERTFEQTKAKTDAEKKAAEDRIQAMQKSEAGIDGAVVSANVSLKNIDAQVKAAQDEHDAAVKALGEAIRARG